MPQFLSPRTFSGAGHRPTSTDPTSGPAVTSAASSQVRDRSKLRRQPRNGVAPASSDGHVELSAPGPLAGFPVESTVPVFWRMGVDDYFGGR